MKICFAVVFVLAVPLPAPGEKKTDAGALTQVRTSSEPRPPALDEFKQNPSPIRDTDFANGRRGAGQYLAQQAQPNQAGKAVPDRLVRTAVIGGMTMTGLWPAISKMFEVETGYRVEVVVTGQRPVLDAALREGKVDLLTMHSGDITTDLVADGFGVNMRPWTRNELCIVGPPNDPAHIRGMTDGAAALRKIAAAQAKFVDFQGIGSRELVHTLWRLADVESKGDWVIKDDTASKFDIVQFARANNAYVVVGSIPAQTGKMYAEGVEIVVKGDPIMRRPFIVMEANPKEIPAGELRRCTRVVRFSAV